MHYYIMRCFAHSGCVLCVILCFLCCIQMSCLCQGSPGKSFYCCKSIYSIVYNTFSTHLLVIYDSFLTLSFLLCIVIFGKYPCVWFRSVGEGFGCHSLLGVGVFLAKKGSFDHWLFSYFSLFV